MPRTIELSSKGLEIEAERDIARAEVERLLALKTPASQELLNITKGCLDNAADEIERLRGALRGMVTEWDKLSRYGSPLAKAANERVNAARRALDSNKMMQGEP